MDSYREHSGDFDQPAGEAASGDDVAAVIGTDERRMHVRAYNSWVSLLDGRDFPSIEDLEPENVQDFAANSVLLDFTCSRDDAAIPYIGGAIREECGLDEATRTISDVPSRSLLSRLTDHYMQIIANRAPIGFEAEFVNQRGEAICYRGILMPFSSDGETIDFIYGVINWKTAGATRDDAAAAVDAEPAFEAPAVEMPELDAPEIEDAADRQAPALEAETAYEAEPGYEAEDADKSSEAEPEPAYESPEVEPEPSYEAPDADAEPEYDAPEAEAESAYEAPEIEADSEPESEALDEAVSIDGIDTGPDEHLSWEDGPSAESPLELTEPVHEAAPHFSWQDGPLADADDDLAPVAIDADAGLADRLWAARETAEAVKSADGRTRAALYQALSLAYDFAVAAQENPDDYAELLEESGVKAQARAPMTPIVKLVFGIDYDKARLTEFAAALSYAQRRQIGVGGFQPLIEKQAGGLKALVAAEREARRPEPRTDTRGEAARARLRDAPALSLAELACAEEFAVVVTRRTADGSHVPVALVDDPALVERAIRRAA